MLEPHLIELDDFDVKKIRRLLSEIAANLTTVESSEFLMQATLMSHELPRSFRKRMEEFRLDEHGCGAVVIRGFPIDARKIGPTPASWDERSAPPFCTLEEEILLILCGALLGDLVTWASEQDGNIVNNVLPIQQYADSQLGWGSTNELIFHVENAASPYSPDYIGLICMRNPDLIGTTISALFDHDLLHLDVDTLFKNNFFIRPDDAHTVISTRRQNDHNPDRYLALSRRKEEIKQPLRTAILFGDQRAPYLRIDPAYMYSDNCEKSKTAMAQFLKTLNANKTRVYLQPGDMVFIDNFRMVHGRDPFKAKYDGTDRWLKRVQVTRDLRKSRAHRASATSRKIL